MVISKTPLRASLFGGGTDFKDYWANSRMGYGTVLSAALDMHVYITVNQKFDDKIRVVYSTHLDCMRTQPPVVGYMVRQLYQGKAVELHYDGKQRRDFVYVENSVRLLALVQ